MKSSMLAFLMAAAALVGLALPTPALAANALATYEKALAKRVGSQFKNGFCLCKGGNFDGATGLISLIEKENASGLYFATVCVVQFFDSETGIPSDAEFCDEDWIPFQQ